MLVMVMELLAAPRVMDLPLCLLLVTRLLLDWSGLGRFLFEGPSFFLSQQLIVDARTCSKFFSWKNDNEKSTDWMEKHVVERGKKKKADHLYERHSSIAYLTF